MAINPKGTPVLTEILCSVTLPADMVVRFVPTADEEHFFTEAYRRFADATQRFSLEAPTASRPHARCTSRSPRIRNTSKSTRKAASSGAGDPDPEPESFYYPLLHLLAVPAFWQLLRPDNPGQNNQPSPETDHRYLCASASPIAFWSAK